jgi:predicted TIM-barrel enzyme
MSTVIEQVKNAAYAGVGVNLLVTDAIVGRELVAPKAVAEHASIARTQATEVLTDVRGRTEPFAAKVTERLPEPVGDAIQTGRKAAWDFIGIDAPAPAKKAAKKATKKATKS